MSRTTQTLQAIEQAILNDDLDFLKKLLKTLPLNKLDKSVSDSLLYRFLLVSAQYEKIEAGQILFETWEIPFTAHKPPVSIYTSLYLDARYNPPLLAFCSKVMRTYTLSECILELITLDENLNLLMACSKLLQVYGPQTLNTYRNLAEASIDVNNVIYNFIIDQVREINEYAPIPDYLITSKILPRESEIIIPVRQPLLRKSQEELDDIYFEVPSDEKIVELLLGGMSDQGFVIDQIEEAEELLRNQLIGMTLENKRKLLEPVMELKFSQEVLQRDRVLFTILGPANPYYGSTREEMKYGGARMFLPGAFDFDPDDDFQEEPHEWFHPYCDYCSRKIRRKWHALRMPVPHGGWQGCYCSFECLEASIEQSDEDEPVRQLLSDIFKQQFYDIGIIDRIPDNEYELYLSGQLELSKHPESSHLVELYQPKMLDENEKEKAIDINDWSDKEKKPELIEISAKKEALIEMIDNPSKFEEIIQTSMIKSVIIYFYRQNCGACSKIKPYFEYYASNYSEFIFAQINVNQASLRKIIKELKIEAVPTFIRYQNRSEIKRLIGANEVELNQLISE